MWRRRRKGLDGDIRYILQRSVSLNEKQFLGAAETKKVHTSQWWAGVSQCPLLGAASLAMCMAQNQDCGAGPCYINISTMWPRTFLTVIKVKGDKEKDLSIHPCLLYSCNY